jgi:hypothetical protein
MPPIHRAAETYDFFEKRRTSRLLEKIADGRVAIAHHGPETSGWSMVSEPAASSEYGIEESDWKEG